MKKEGRRDSCDCQKNSSTEVYVVKWVLNNMLQLDLIMCSKMLAEGSV